MAITCLACGHIDNDSQGVGLLDGVFRCSECNARMVYGKLAPRIVIEPYVDDSGRPFVRQRIQDPITKADVSVTDLDPQHAAMTAKAILSVVIP